MLNWEISIDKSRLCQNQAWKDETKKTKEGWA